MRPAACDKPLPANIANQPDTRQKMDQILNAGERFDISI